MTHYTDSMHISEDELISLLLDYAQCQSHGNTPVAVLSRDQQLLNLKKSAVAVKYVSDLRTNGPKLFKEYLNKSIEPTPTHAAAPVKEFDPFNL